MSTGPKQNEGYRLIFNILLRPPLMLLGPFLGCFVASAFFRFAGQSFGIACRSTSF